MARHRALPTSGLAKKSHRIIVQDFLLLNFSHILSLQKILRRFFSRLAVRIVGGVKELILAQERDFLWPPSRRT
jgi:hypothetical protein